jgi:glutamyl-tRNA reductase
MDHNASSVDERRDFSAAASGRARDLLSGGAMLECVKLETCNRFELYAVFSDGAEREAADWFAPRAGVMWDYAAVRHLMRVLLGLESMAKGESHIVSQVKAAYAESPSRGKTLHRLFQRALGITASLRRGHPGREPSLSRVAALHYLEHSSPDRAVMVVGMGAVGRETAHVLLLSGCPVLAANRTPRVMDEKLSAAEIVPWGLWKERAADCGAVFLCTSSPAPVMSASDAEAMRGAWVFDLGAPHQSEPSDAVTRITLDEMKDIADSLIGDYGKSIAELEAEADKASGALLAEISLLTDDTWKHLAMSRAGAIIRDRASRYAARCGASEDELEAFASSVMKAFLHPLVRARAAHGARAWRILSGECEEGAEE